MKIPSIVFLPKAIKKHFIPASLMSLQSKWLWITDPDPDHPKVKNSKKKQ